MTYISKYFSTRSYICELLLANFTIECEMEFKTKD